ncbi:hypothetical protein ILUMI_07053 [Ignelater luminosus]|uniref:Uncharacterized protein n=1 Tax=Ignelater luminosus TaxID=2038154 RepID=A0A8K0D849_IGNLU|nr:hypothetical protein ILUMI_07053 [Ignelater luminosus]
MPRLDEVKNRGCHGSIWLKENLTIKNTYCDLHLRGLYRIREGLLKTTRSKESNRLFLNQKTVPEQCEELLHILGRTSALTIILQ